MESATSLLVLVFCLWRCHVTVNASTQQTVTVEAPFGKIKGAIKTQPSTDRNYILFRNIPYAKPPVGELRFAKPQPHPKLGEFYEFVSLKKRYIVGELMSCLIGALAIYAY